MAQVLQHSGTKKVLLGKPRWASLSHPLEPEAGSAGGPLHTWGLSLVMKLTHHAPLHTHKKTLSGLGFPVCKTWQLPQTISESSHSNTAHLFVSLGPPDPPAATTPSTVTEKRRRFPATGSTQRLRPPLPTLSSQVSRGLSVASCFFQATLGTYFKLKSSGQKHKGLEEGWGVTSGFFRAIFPRACTDPRIRREPRARIYQMPVIHSPVPASGENVLHI